MTMVGLITAILLMGGLTVHPALGVAGYLFFILGSLWVTR